MLNNPFIGMIDNVINQGIIKTNSTSKTKYSKPIIKYCKSNILLRPKGSKPHSYWDVFSNRVTL